MTSLELDASLVRIISTVDSKHVDVIRALIKSNTTINALKLDGMTIFNVPELVSCLMKELSKVKTISGQSKKELVVSLFDELLEGSPDAELIRSMIPPMVNGFCKLLINKNSLVKKIKANLYYIANKFKCFK